MRMAGGKFRKDLLSSELEPGTITLAEYYRREERNASVDLDSHRRPRDSRDHLLDP